MRHSGDVKFGLLTRWHLLPMEASTSVVCGLYPKFGRNESKTSFLHNIEFGLSTTFNLFSSGYSVLPRIHSLVA